MSALFHNLGGGSYGPTEYTRGPWRSDAQHGGPPSALLGRLTEEQLSAGERVARIVVELVRPVPLTKLDSETEVEVVSRRVRRIRSQLLSEGEPVAQATAAVSVESSHAVPDTPPSASPEFPAASVNVRAPVWMTGEDEITYHRDSVEHRFLSGGFSHLGPSDGWHRLVPDLVRDEETSPLSRVLAIADFASGVSSIFDESTGMGLINSDLDVAVVRPLSGSWVHLQAETQTDGSGTGLCTSSLGDELGPCASATQCLLAVALK